MPIISNRDGQFRLENADVAFGRDQPAIESVTGWSDGGKDAVARKQVKAARRIGVFGNILPAPGRRKDEVADPLNIRQGDIELAGNVDVAPAARACR